MFGFRSKKSNKPVENSNLAYNNCISLQCYGQLGSFVTNEEPEETKDIPRLVDNIQPTTLDELLSFIR